MLLAIASKPLTKPVYTDCKSWFDEGYNTSGVYAINPDEQIPFEVRG